MRLLAPQGVLLFSTNPSDISKWIQRAFAVSGADISAATLPFDFKGNPRIHHRCFELRTH